MMASPISSQIEQVAYDFWQPLLTYRTFPVDIDRAVALSNLPLLIFSLSNLTVKAVQQWAIQNNHPVSLSAEDRALHGFLLAHQGTGIIFVNGTDPIEERRYTIAHEVAHFLLDYQLPRQRFICAFGESILEVLDGHREPSLSERLRFITADLPSPFSVHHLDGSQLTAYDRYLVWQGEQRVDSLATELLAPYQEVIYRLELRAAGNHIDPIISLLSTTFGLPNSVCKPYAQHIDYHISGGKTLADEWSLV